jgi:hypothetical protein
MENGLMGEVIDKRKMFYDKKGPGNNQEEWIVTINVAVNLSFFRKVIYCFFHKKQLIVSQVFKKDPVKRGPL